MNVPEFLADHDPRPSVDLGSSYRKTVEQLLQAHRRIADRSYGTDPETKLAILSHQIILLFNFIAEAQQKGRPHE